MSARLIVKAMAARVGSPTRKIVLIKLADNANDAGDCWPSLQHIADDCEMTKRAVRNQINALIEMGLVSKKPRYHDNRQCSNGYHLTLDSIAEGGRNEVPPGGNEVPGEGERGSSPGGNEVPPEEPPIGTCHKNQGGEAGKPDWMDADIWSAKPEALSAEMWVEFVAHRDDMKKPLTVRAARMLNTTLNQSRAKGHDPDQMVRTSIENGWRGVFEPKVGSASPAKIKPRKEL